MQLYGVTMSVGWRRRTAVQLCLGVTPLDDHTEQPKQAWRERAQHWKSGIERDALSLVQEAKMLNKLEGYAGDGGLHDDLDAADELANIGTLFCGKRRPSAPPSLLDSGTLKSPFSPQVGFFGAR